MQRMMHQPFNLSLCVSNALGSLKMRPAELCFGWTGGGVGISIYVDEIFVDAVSGCGGNMGGVVWVHGCIVGVGESCGLWGAAGVGKEDFREDFGMVAAVVVSLLSSFVCAKHHGR